MNIVTHGLASLALARAAWPRAPKRLWVVAIGAGIIVDLDFVSAWSGAAAYLKWHHTFTHSLLATIIFAALCALAYRCIAGDSLRAQFSVANTFALAFAAAAVHLLLDVCDSQGALLLWQFSTRRFAKDWIVELDPWVIAVLLGALLFPELLHLVSAEIGARDTKPRGRIGAMIGFGIIVVYVAIRADFHSNVLALMESRTFHGEVSNRVAAYPATLSPLEWHALVDTQRALHQVTVMEGPKGSFDPETAETLFKPEPSPALDAAQKTEAAETFLKTARFPKATVETMATGSTVVLRDLSAEAMAQTSHEVAATIHLDAANRVISQEIVWAKQLSQVTAIRSPQP
jgi:membrane-bound metal-dependent hydrolase YbcI (DUF457 family)